MLKALGVGFIILIIVLVAFSAFTGAHPEAAHAPVAKLEPVDRALVACESWTRENSKLSMGAIEQEYSITGAKLPAGHHLVEILYRTKDQGLLMHAECEYVGDGQLVRAKSSLK